MDIEFPVSKMLGSVLCKLAKDGESFEDCKFFFDLVTDDPSHRVYEETVLLKAFRLAKSLKEMALVHKWSRYNSDIMGKSLGEMYRLVSACTSFNECIEFLAEVPNFPEFKMRVLERSLDLARYFKECLELSQISQDMSVRSNIILEKSLEKGLSFASTVTDCLDIFHSAPEGSDLKYKSLQKALPCIKSTEEALTIESNVEVLTMASNVDVRKFRRDLIKRALDLAKTPEQCVSVVNQSRFNDLSREASDKALGLARTFIDYVVIFSNDFISIDVRKIAQDKFLGSLRASRSFDLCMDLYAMLSSNRGDVKTIVLEMALDRARSHTQCLGVFHRANNLRLSEKLEDRALRKALRYCSFKGSLNLLLMPLDQPIQIYLLAHRSKVAKEALEKITDFLKESKSVELCMKTYKMLPVGLEIKNKALEIAYSLL